jgi:phosphoglycerate dehydrogenase-like enzyme
LNGQTAGILGVGKIGTEIARKLKCLGMQVIGNKRRPSLPSSADVDEIFCPDKLHEFLTLCDWVIVSAPLTAQTRHLLGETEFRMMKPSAWYINIARGEIADEDALIRAIDQGWIAGACLDAFTHEPLPPDSPFWDHPKVVMTPHNSSASPNTRQRNLDLVFDNLNRFIEGKDLRNIVDKAMGY